MSDWIDVTLPLNDRLPMLGGEFSPPGSKVVEPTVYRFFDVNKGDPVTMSRIEVNSHDGTHIDAPLHFIPGGMTIDRMPVETAVGPARVIGIDNPREITVEELAPHNIGEGERVLFKTANSPRVYAVRRYAGDYCALTLAAAEYLAARKVRLVGLDYLTIAHADPPENINAVHKALLTGGVFILEALDLDGVTPGDYDMVCLPLRLENGDAAPCRVCIRPVEE